MAKKQTLTIPAKANTAFVIQHWAERRAREEARISNECSDRAIELRKKRNHRDAKIEERLATKHSGRHEAFQQMAALVIEGE